jgi:hypothetical protein
MLRLCLRIVRRGTAAAGLLGGVDQLVSEQPVRDCLSGSYRDADLAADGEGDRIRGVRRRPYPRACVHPNVG